MMLGAKAPNCDIYGLFRVLRSHNPSQYSDIVYIITGKRPPEKDVDFIHGIRCKMKSSNNEALSGDRGTFLKEVSVWTERLRLHSMDAVRWGNI